MHTSVFCTATISQTESIIHKLGLGLGVAGMKNLNTARSLPWLLRLVPLLLLASLGGSVAYAAGPAPVNLRSAGSFAILSQTGVTNVPTSAVNGDVGASPITGAAILLTCNQVVGNIYSVDAAGPLPCRIINATKLTTAVSDMQTAYTDAAGRPATVTELGAGNIGGLILAPGVYKWSSNVMISTDVTFSGRAHDVWILQIAGNLELANAQKVLLRGGALPNNIFWQVSGKATLGTTSQFNGTILSKTLIAMNTGAAIHGRLLAQTAVTLQKNVVKRP